MPISLPIETHRISQSDFAEIAYAVMNHVFAIHNEFGRFFDEKIYKRELAARMKGISLEVPISVSFGTFVKPYFLDVLAHAAGLFEFKSVDAIHPRHRGQTINYLLLADLAHAKIINIRPEQVEHEFVNCNQRRIELRDPTIRYERWNDSVPGAQAFSEVLRSLVADWGTGLELPLYEAALCHFLEGQADISVTGSIGQLGVQRMRLAAPDVAFKLTAMRERSDPFVVHSHRLLAHTTLKAILWANLTHSEIRFETIQRAE